VAFDTRAACVLARGADELHPIQMVLNDSRQRVSPSKLSGFGSETITPPLEKVRSAMKKFLEKRASADNNSQKPPFLGLSDNTLSDDIS
jgi:hypothetical protein